ncbi:hypothetical protein D3C75_417710 [compost metagenome]
MLITRKKRRFKILMKKTFLVLIILALSLACITPITLYFFIFHNGLSNSSQDWGAFGSYVGGIYAPLAAIISVFVLVRTLQVMESSHQESSQHQFKEKQLENIRWLTDLLRSMLTKKYSHGHDAYYETMRTLLVQKLTNDHKPDSAIVKNKAIEIMKENKDKFQDECIIFDDLFYRVTHSDDLDDGALSCMILIAKFSPEERFWLMQYAKAHDCRAAKDLKLWRGFEDVPTSLSYIVK